jgi:hypothetical protein
VKTSAVVTAAGSFGTVEKKTFRSKATASSVLRLARAPTKAR